MPLLFQPPVTRQQIQQSPAPINRGNLLGKKVITHFPFRPNYLRSTAGETLAFVGNTSYQTLLNRYTLKTAASGASSSTLDLSRYQQITVAFNWFNTANTSTNRCLLEFSTNYNNATNSFLISDESTGVMQVSWHTTPANLNYSTCTFARPSLSVLHRMAVTMDISKAGNDAAATSVWVDGVNQGVTPAGAAAASGARFFGSFQLFIMMRSGSTLLNTAQMEALTFYSGALTESEIQSDFRNPYQIFAPRPRRMFARRSFNAAWARGSNSVIGGGPRL